SLFPLSLTLLSSHFPSSSLLSSLPSSLPYRPIDCIMNQEDQGITERLLQERISELERTIRSFERRTETGQTRAMIAYCNLHLINAYFMLVLLTWLRGQRQFTFPPNEVSPSITHSRSIILPFCTAETETAELRFHERSTRNDINDVNSRMEAAGCTIMPVSRVPLMMRLARQHVAVALDPAAVSTFQRLLQLQEALDERARNALQYNVQQHEQMEQQEQLSPEPSPNRSRRSSDAAAAAEVAIINGPDDSPDIINLAQRPGPPVQPFPLEGLDTISPPPDAPPPDAPPVAADAAGIVRNSSGNRKRRRDGRGK
ncbi:hypothetical protein PFISCL1PPCAC_14223, partial [Pristionchus fissidentatus]